MWHNILLEEVFCEYLQALGKWTFNIYFVRQWITVYSRSTVIFLHVIVIAEHDYEYRHIMSLYPNIFSKYIFQWDIEICFSSILQNYIWINYLQYK